MIKLNKKNYGTKKKCAHIKQRYYYYKIALIILEFYELSLTKNIFSLIRIMKRNQ